MSYPIPSEFVAKMVDAAEPKMLMPTLMPTQDTLIGTYLAGGLPNLLIP